MTTDDDRAAAPRSHWRWLGGWGAGCGLALVAAFVLGSFVRSPWETAIDSSRATPVVTATVEHRRLTVDTGTLTGAVALGSTTDVAPPAAAEVPVVTAARKTAGDTLRPGEALADVSGRPLIALGLPFRLYRDLVPGAAEPGPDVAAVQQALAELGLYRGAVDGVYGTGTAEAVAQLYRRAAVAPPPAPAEAVAALTAATQADADAAAALRAAEAELQSAPRPGGDGGAAAAEAASRVPAARAARDAARVQLEAARLAASTPLPMAEVLRVPAAGVTVVSIAAVGSEPSVDDGAPVVARLRSGEPSVRVRVGASDAGAYPVGAAVTVAAVADGTRRASGTVAAVGPFSPAPSDDGAPPGYDVTVLLPPEHPFTDGLEVTVDAADASVLEGLTVPLVAVREDPDGAYVLVPGDGDDREPRRVGVTVTGSADGYAVVTGDDLSAGRSVIISDGT